MTLPLNQVLCGDCIEVMQGFPADSVDTIITDPPYGLGFMSKKWDTFNPDHIKKHYRPQRKKLIHKYDIKNGERVYRKKAEWVSCEAPSDTAGHYDRSLKGNRGFQSWTTAWATEALRVAKPGAMMFVFGGTRTFHRLACGIEDAGWELRDTVMWVYASGFPKSLSIALIYEKELCEWDAEDKEWYYIGTKEKMRRKPPFKSDNANTWWGWGTALKPAWEPVIVAMKPLDGTFANNALTHGVAGLWIDGGRVGYQSDSDKASATPQGQCTARSGRLAGKVQGGGERDTFTRPKLKGRFPSNLIHDGSEEVLAGFPRAGNEWKRNYGEDDYKGRQYKGGSFGGGGYQGDSTYADSGSAARFFQSAKYTEIELLFYRAKGIIEVWNNELVNTVDKSLVLRSEAAVSALSGAVIVGSRGDKRLSDVMGLSMSVMPSELRILCESVIVATLSLESEHLQGLLLDEPIPNGSRVRFAETPKQTGITTITISHWKSDGSADAATLEITPLNSELGAKVSSESRLKYCAKASRAERNAGLEGMEARQRDLSRRPDQKAMNDGEGNPYNRGCKPVTNDHPTVKPLALMQYLVRLSKTPTGGVVLDCFCGSGSTLVACIREGREFIGIDSEEHYCEIARRRVQHERNRTPLFVSEKATTVAEPATKEK